MTQLGGLLILIGFAGWAITAMRRKPYARGKTHAGWVEGYWVVVFPAPRDLVQWQVWTAPEAWKERALDELMAQATTYSSERAWDDAGVYIRETLV